MKTQDYPFAIGMPADLYRGFAVYHFTEREDTKRFYAEIREPRWVAGERNPAFDPTKTPSPENPKLIPMRSDA